MAIRRGFWLLASTGVFCVLAGSGALIAQTYQYYKCPTPYNTTFCPNAPVTTCQGSPINCSNSSGNCANAPSIAYQSFSQGSPVLGSYCYYTANPNDRCSQVGTLCNTYYDRYQCCQEVVCQVQNYILFCQ
jgi:hypothetical protein